MTDSEDKRNEIAQLYTSMSDLELKDLAEEAWSLTEIGKEKLRAELARNKVAAVEASVDEAIGAKWPTLREWQKDHRKFFGGIISENLASTCRQSGSPWPFRFW